MIKKNKMLNSRDSVYKLIDRFHAEIIRQVANIRSCCARNTNDEARYCLMCKFYAGEVKHFKKMILWATEKMKEIEAREADGR